MPIMRVTYLEGAVTEAQKSALAQRLTDLMITMEGGAGTRGGRTFAWVIYDEIKSGNWWAGGRTDGEYVAAPGRFLVTVRIPEGYMNAAHKVEVQVGVNDAIMAVMGASGQADAGGSAQVIIDEVTEGNWAAAGKTISLGSIADSVGLARTGERFAWVKAYFAAKAREYEAAGYPTDTGGLLPPGA